MSDDVCKAYSTGHIGQLSTQQLSESLVYERIRSEQHRLNYERLRALYDKLQNDLDSSNLANTTPTIDTTVNNENEQSEQQQQQDAINTPVELTKSPKRCSLGPGPSSYSNPGIATIKKSPLLLLTSPENSTTVLPVDSSN